MPRFASAQPSSGHAPSVTHVTRENLPRVIARTTTVLFVHRDGKPKARFDVQSSLTSNKHAILLCTDGPIFHQLMIEHCVVGTKIEFFLPDGTIYSYDYRV